MPMYNFKCSSCEETMEDLVPIGTQDIPCEHCGAAAERLWTGKAPNLLTTIILDYPGSKKFKAGYVHSHGDKDATKVQSGYGGSQSPT